MKDIYKSVVNKPWGQEHCAYKEENLSIWMLQINPNQKTSLHCHPIKKTSLIALNGIARVRLIEREFDIIGLGKTIFRNGMFHQTYNPLEEPLFLFEVETPNDKFDLIRIEDDYGRKKQAFEGEEHWRKIEDSNFQIFPNKKNSLLGLFIEVKTVGEILSQKDLADESIVVVLGDCAFLSEDKQRLCEYGEVLTMKIVRFLDARFSTQLNSKAIVIWRK